MTNSNKTWGDLWTVRMADGTRMMMVDDTKLDELTAAHKGITVSPAVHIAHHLQDGGYDVVLCSTLGRVTVASINSYSEAEAVRDRVYQIPVDMDRIVRERRAHIYHDDERMDLRWTWSPVELTGGTPSPYPVKGFCVGCQHYGHECKGEDIKTCWTGCVNHVALAAR